MSLDAVLARVGELNSFMVQPVSAPLAAALGAQLGSTGAGGRGSSGAGGPTSFAGMLQGAAAAAPTAALALPPGAGGRGALVAAVQAEVGQAEAPPGSNDSPRIAEYRSATPAAPGPGPWCAYFTSWAARQAGMPLGDRGEGFGSVDALYSWAQGAGRAVPAGSGTPPQPGDLIVWDEHMGVVEAVRPDGTVETIEGNSSDRVSRRTHPAGSALGYVRMGP